MADAALTTPASFTITSTEGQTFSGLVTTFQYGNPAATAGNFTASIVWGNGNTTTGQIVADPQGNGVFDVDGSNFYSEFGPYPVTVTITDSAGTTITANGTATVSDCAALLDARDIRRPGGDPVQRRGRVVHRQQ